MSTFFLNAGIVMLDIALFGLICVIGLAVYTAVTLKRDVARNAKRFYERPMRSIKNLSVTGQGIVRQESVRIGHIAEHGKTIVTCVRETGAEAVTAVRSFSSVDVATMMNVIKTGAKAATAAAEFAKAVSRQGASS
jgi:hypothetical protein